MERSADPTHGLRLDRLLRFDPATAARHEDEHGAERIRDIQHNILLGLIFYNVYNLTSIALMPDIFWLSVGLRLFAVTAASLVLVWAVARLPPIVREWLLMVAVFNAILFPILFFWLTRAPLGNYTFGELSLSIYFANMVMVLRFAPALMLNVLTTAVVTLAVLTKPGLPPALVYAFVVQFVTATTFAGLGNFFVERRRCLEYLRTLNATIRAEDAEKLRSTLVEMSQTDALTGLPNRRYLDQHLADWFDSDCKIAVMMIDVDRFKRFNDHLGHQAGDACLQRLADVFKLETRDADSFAARFGGEEFIVVVRHQALLDVARLAQKLLRAVESQQIVHPHRQDGIGVVTVSIGIAHLTDRRGASVATLLAAADEALYRAKRLGRNRFMIFDGEVGATSRQAI